MSQILPNECLYILQIFCSFSESFSHPGDEGMGETRTTFSLGVVQFFHPMLFKFGVFSCAVLQDGFLNTAVSGKRGNHIFIVFPLQDNLDTTGEMKRPQKCVVSA